jgi:hypothetical protein
MVNLGTLLPHLLLGITLGLELVAFMTAHMIGSRNLKQLHDGIFFRCTYPSRNDAIGFNCLWWSSDTFNIDKRILKLPILLVIIN